MSDKNLTKEEADGGPYRKSVRCPKCGGEIIISTPQRPLEIECPKCHKKGMLKRDTTPVKGPLKKLRVSTESSGRKSWK